MNNTVKFCTLMNQLAILGLMAAVILASVFEFTIPSPPCPLCLLQRIGLLAICFGLLCNLLFGFRPHYYAFSLIAALFTAAAAGRQVLLHIIPDPAYTAGCTKTLLINNSHCPILGFSLYTWTFILAFCMIALIAFLFLIEKQFVYHPPAIHGPIPITLFNKILLIAIILLTLFNAGNTFLLCGYDFCPDNPVTYRYIFMDKHSW